MPSSPGPWPMRAAFGHLARLARTCTACGHDCMWLPHPLLVLNRAGVTLGPAGCVACRPLVLGMREGRYGEEWCVASEDCAFGPIGFKRVRDVRPGEMVIITPDGKLVSRQCVEVRSRGLVAWCAGAAVP